MTLAAPLNLKKWIDDNRHLLKPPVGNKMIYNEDFMVMIVAGPNQRLDYHINPTQELFYQLEGDIVVRVMENGAPRDIPIREGEMFLLPPNIPHSPQRPANTIGLVVEHRRPENNLDHMRWYCPQCTEVVHDAEFFLVDVGAQIKPVIEKFFSDESLRKCKKCGTTVQKPN